VRSGNKGKFLLYRADLSALFLIPRLPFSLFLPALSFYLPSFFSRFHSVSSFPLYSPHPPSLPSPHPLSPSPSIRVIMCAYAFMNLDANVLLIDCWRRWKLYQAGRVKWKALSWQYQWLWHDSRAKGYSTDTSARVCLVFCFLD
jgi:hypothetical protein